MAFLRTPAPERYLDPIVGPKLILRAPSAADYVAWAELRALSRQHLTRWEPQWSRDDLSRNMFRRRLKAYACDMRDDAAYTFFITDAVTRTLYGGLSITNVRRGAAQSATLGYWMGQPHIGQGRMREAVRMVLPFVFQYLRLNRLEAATMAANVASIRVLEASGFSREGVVRSYLKINGVWQDHVLYAKLASDAASSAPSTSPDPIVTLAGQGVTAP